MTNLTLSIDNKLLQAARLRAVKEGTSVNEICRQALQAYVQPAGQSRLAHYLQVQDEIDRSLPAYPGQPSSRHTREQLYDEVLKERHPTLSGVRKKTSRTAG